jgi:hypothetical protein
VLAGNWPSIVPVGLTRARGSRSGGRYRTSSSSGRKRPLLADELARLIGGKPCSDRLVVGRHGQLLGGADRLVHKEGGQTRPAEIEILAPVTGAHSLEVVANKMPIKRVPA